MIIIIISATITYKFVLFLFCPIYFIWNFIDSNLRAQRFRRWLLCDTNTILQPWKWERECVSRVLGSRLLKMRSTTNPQIPASKFILIHFWTLPVALFCPVSVRIPLCFFFFFFLDLVIFFLWFWHCQFPEPQLSTACGPMWMLPTSWHDTGRHWNEHFRQISRGARGSFWISTVSGIREFGGIGESRATHTTN